MSAKSIRWSAAALVGALACAPGAASDPAARDNDASGGGENDAMLPHETDADARGAGGAAGSGELERDGETGAGTEAGPIAGDAGGSECTGTKARSGEPCAIDTDCGSGLLCDASVHTCRAISGVTFVDFFYPAGRTEAYSEGLDFAHGSLWQSTPTTLWRIDVATGAVVASYPTPSAYGEGLTWRGNVLYNVSYRDSFLYAAELKGVELEFERVGELQMTGGCVYGIVDHCDELYTTRCGQSVVDVYASGTTSPILRTFTVSDAAGTPLSQVEDLEIYRGQLWTSTFDSRVYNRTLFRIDFESQRAVAAYDIPCTTLAIDGVAVDPATRTLYVTGKDCPIFVYRIQ